MINNEQSKLAYNEWKGLIEALNITQKQQGLPAAALDVLKKLVDKNPNLTDFLNLE